MLTSRNNLQSTKHSALWYKGRVYHSEEDDGDIWYNTDFQEKIWEDEGHEEETRELSMCSRGYDIY